MTDREFDARAYDQGVRDGRHEAAAEISRLREALGWIRDACRNGEGTSEYAYLTARAALGGDNG